MRLLIDDAHVPAEEGDSLLTAMLRADLHPTGGGCLCLAGDCPHCLAVVDGIGYVRTCQVKAREGQVVERRHRDGGKPPLFRRDAPEKKETPARHLHCDVAVVGQGAAGREAAAAARAAGRRVVTLDAGEGQEAIGIYAGPLVVARSEAETLSVHVGEEVVVATGASEIQPVAPGDRLAGLVTARAAAALARAGIGLGRVVALGTPPEGVACTRVEGELIRFEGAGRVEAVVVRDSDGTERRHAADTVSLGLGLQPRNALARMGEGLPVRAVGDAARDGDTPPAPRAGTVCPCNGIDVGDLDSCWERGFRELELMKRASLAGTGTCQGGVCLPHLRAYLGERSGTPLPAPFTARPVTRQPTLGEVAAGAFHRTTLRTPLHDELVAAGARMQRAGGWWRPWSYGDPADEYRAVRERVSLGDVGTLGKFRVSGPDALDLLELLYPTPVATLKPGRSRYALLLDERGYVLDDGLVCRDGETRFTLTLTSAGSTFGEMWLRDWADARAFDVRILNQTASLGAINVTGPRAAELMARAGVADLPAFAAHAEATAAGVGCRIFRLSFTGETSFELHHAAGDSVRLWRRLMALGADLGIRPHGLKTLLDLRLEKGHIVVGQDTDLDSTPRRIGHEWAIRKEKRDFVGRTAVLRTDREPLDRQLVGLEMDSPAPIEGAVIWSGDAYAGYLTSATDSPALGRAVMLGWVALEGGALPDTVRIDGRPARRVATPFYDPEGGRARGKTAPAPSAARPAPAVEPDPALPGGFLGIEGSRVVASPAALDTARWPTGARVLRIAPDEALVDAPVSAAAVADPHAIVERETGFAGLWLDAAEAERRLARACPFELPRERPAFVQGAVAEVPVKLWLEPERVRVVVPRALAAELAERLA